MLYQIVPSRYPSFVISADSDNSAIERAGKRIHGFWKQENPGDQTVWNDNIRTFLIMEFPGGGCIAGLQIQVLLDRPTTDWFPMFETVFTLIAKL